MRTPHLLVGDYMRPTRPERVGWRPRQLKSVAP